MTNRKFLSLLLALFMVFGTFIPSFAENDSVTVLPPRMAEKDKEPDNIVIMEDEKDTIPILNESEEGGTKEEELPNEQDVKDNAPLILEDRKEDNIVILPPIRNEKEEEKKEEEPQEETEKSEEPQEIKEEKKEVKVQILSKRDVKKPASEGEVNLVLLNDNPADVNEEVYDEKIRWKESDFNIEDDKIISLSDEGLLKAKINKKLVIPEMENITVIEKQAFKGLSLRSVEIPKNINEIKDEAFKDNQLKLVKILGKGKEISKNAFNKELVEEYEKCEDEEFLYEYGDKENELEIGEEIVGDAVGAVAPDDVSLYTFNGTTITGLSEKGKTYYNDNHDMVLPGKSPQGKVITKIEDRAFYNSWGSYRLTSVDFSNCTSLTGIGSEAFRNNELTSLDLSGCKSLSGIDYNAFLGNQLTNLNLSGCTNLKFIGGSAFNNNQLASLDLSGCTSLISIDGSAFDSNQLASLDLSGCTSLESIDSEAFNHNQITNLNLSGCVNLTSIGFWAFNQNQLTSLDLSGCINLTSIGQVAFGYSRLKTAKIPLSLKNLADNAFYRNPGNNDKKQVYLFTPDYTNPNNLKDTDYHLINPITGSDDVSLYTFSGTTITGLSEKGKIYYATNHDMVLPGKNPQGQAITAIGEDAFFKRDQGGVGYGLTSVDFSNCISLTSIGDSAFMNNQLTSLDLSGLTSLTSIDGTAFQQNQLTSLDLSGCINLAKIGQSAFSGNQLTSLNLSGCTSLTSISGTAFIYNKLTNLNLSGLTSLTSIDGRAFAGNQLTSLNLSGCTNLTSIGAATFAGNQITNLDLSECTSLASIGFAAFATNKLKTVKIPLSLKTLAENAFGKNLGNNAKKQVYLYTPDYTNPNNLKDTDYHLINPVESSDDTTLYTFSGIVITGLSERGKKYFETHHDMVLPGKNPQGEAITEIEDRAFCNDWEGYGLTSVDFSECKELVDIGRFAFANNQITNVNLSECKKLEIIERSAFANNQITNVNLSNCEALEIIESEAFRDNQITTVDLSNCTSLDSIRGYAFYKNKLESLDLSGCTNLTLLGSYVFAQNQLKAADIPMSLKYLGGTTFKDNIGSNDKKQVYLYTKPYRMNPNNLQDSEYHLINFPITGPDDVTLYTFDGTTITGLTERGKKYFKENPNIKLPGKNPQGESITAIADNAFSPEEYDETFPKFKSIDFSNSSSLVTIGKSAFDNHVFDKIDLSPCTNLQEIGDGAFALSEDTDSSGDKKIEVGFKGLKNLKRIGRGAFAGPDIGDRYRSFDFSGCTGLEIIDDWAFAANSLRNLDLSDCSNLKSIGKFAFSTCGLMSVNLSNCTSLTKIDKLAFSSNGPLQNLDMSNCSNLEIIEESAFDNSALKNVDLSTCTNLKTIGANAFGYSRITEGKIPLSLITLADNAFQGNPGNNDKKQVYLYTPDYTNPNNLKDTNYHLINPITGPDDVSLYTFNGTVITGLSDRGKKYFKENPNLVLPEKNPEGESIIMIGPNAFSPEEYDENYPVFESIDFSNCSSLLAIGNGAFAGHYFDKLDLSPCTSLIAIGDSAFAFNEGSHGPEDKDIEVSFRGLKNLKTIGESAFAGPDIGNRVGKIDFSGCTGLETIGEGAFFWSRIDNLDLSSCTNLKTIKKMAFMSTDLKTLNLSGCKNLTTIEEAAFHGNKLNSIDFSGCSNLQTIGSYAFAFSSLKTLDLSKCTSLKVIEKGAFYNGKINIAYIPLSLSTLADDAFQDNPGNNDKKQVYLYTPDYTNPNNLSDTDYHLINPITGSDDVSLYTFDGTTITGLSERGKEYFKENHEMVLPGKTPDGQDVTAIGRYAFDKNNSGYGITSVDFKNLTKLKNIGPHAFQYNPITSIDFSHCTELENIDEFAFFKNQISEINFSNCKNLSTIGNSSFSINKIKNLNMSDCINLKEIDEYAFSLNEIKNLDLSACKNLNTIKRQAFSSNELNIAKIPFNLQNVDTLAFEGNPGKNKERQVFLYTPIRNNPQNLPATDYHLVDPITFTIKKVDAKGNPMRGVEFAFYKVDRPTPPAPPQNETNKTDETELEISSENVPSAVGGPTITMPDIDLNLNPDGPIPEFFPDPKTVVGVKPIFITVTTNFFGEAEVTLPYSPYFLVENKTIPGYSINNTVTPIDATTEGKIITYTDYEVSIEIPETGTLGTLPYILLALILVGGAYVVLRKKKEEEARD